MKAFGGGAWFVRLAAASWLLALLVLTGCGGFGGENIDETSLPACTVSVLSANPVGPSDPGTVVTLTASPASCAGGETAEYRFAYQRDGTTDPYVQIKDWGTNVASWNTAGLPSGKYYLIVYSRAVGSGVTSQSAARATFLIKNVCTTSSLTASPLGPQPPGTSVTLTSTAGCTGGATPEFRFTYKAPGSSVYTQITPFSTTNNTAWNTTGLPSGTYDLLVYVRASGNPSTSETAAHYTYLLGGVCSSVTLGAAPASPQPVGTNVTLTANATCGVGLTPEYRFMYRPPGSSTYIEIQAFSTTNTANWATTGLPGGAYTIAVQVRAQGSTSIEGAASQGYTLGSASGSASVTAGVMHSCVLVNGGVKCFGRNLIGTPTGQTSTDRGLEAGDMGDALPAVDLGGGSIVEVARGAYHTCALLAGGGVKCWGANGSGELGLGDTNHRSAGAGELGAALPAVNLGTGKTATAITSGGGFNCAILNDASVKCWGSNGLGQLGLGDTNPRGDGPGEMGDALPTVNLGTGRTAKAISAGASHVCAILDNDALKCWGFNTYGSLGLGDTVTRGDNAGEMGDSLAAVNLGTGRHAVQISMGALLSCAVLDNSTAKCWGYNAYGQVGQGDTNTRGDNASEMGDSLPAITLGQNVASVAAGGQHACAVLANGSLKCWGYNTDGELGVGDTNNRGDQAGEMAALPAVNLGTGRTALIVTGSYLNTCAALDNGTMKCWGASWNGMLGIGPSDTRGDQPSDMGDSLPSFNFGAGRTPVSLGSGFGYHFGCAVLDNATLKCWGANSYGQLGIDRSSNTGEETQDMGGPLAYVNLGSGGSVTQVAAGDTHSCALLSNGSVKCWGSNRYGTLGLGDTAVRSGRAVYMGNNLPAVNLGGTATAIAVGSDHSCAILTGGSVKCWGTNAFGELGLGDTNTRGDNAGEMGPSLPAVNLGAHTAKSLSLGYRHTCAVLEDNSIRCWGWNLYGQLGQGDQANRGDNAGEMGASLLAVSLGTGRTALSVHAGVYNTCAILDNGSIKCWGVNGQGQLGLGDTLMRGYQANQMGDNLPAVNVGTGRTVVSASLGSQHVCARLDNQTLKCWGQGTWGKLGYGDTSNRGDAAGEMGDSLPAVSFGSATVTGVSAGWNHNCASLSDGSIKCWGLNDGGELGLGDSTTRGDNGGEMGSALPAVNLGAL